MTEKEKVQLAKLDQKLDDFIEWAKSNWKIDCTEHEKLKDQVNRQGNELNQIRGIGIAITVIIAIIEAVGVWLSIHIGGGK